MMSVSSVTISSAWLAQHLSDPGVAMMDCRFSLTDPTLGRQQYQQGHIPGAYYLDLDRDLSSPAQVHGGRHPLPNSDLLAAKLSSMGVTDQTFVVAYDDSRFAFAARLWWLLRYLGHDRVAVLDGGFSAYQAAGFPLTPKIPEPRVGNFQPHPRLNWVVDIHDVNDRKTQPDVVLIDSREGDRYRGEREPIDPVAGHIPGAVNYPWQQVTDTQGFLKAPEELRSHWSAIVEAEEAIVYCGSGVTACVNMLALEAAGIQGGKLYAGSWSDWCSYPLHEDWNINRC